MAIKGYCGGDCGNMSKCSKCELDLLIPCSPNCENLTEDGMIKIAKCLADGCDEIKHIFGVAHKSDEEVIHDEYTSKTA